MVKLDDLFKKKEIVTMGNTRWHDGTGKSYDDDFLLNWIKEAKSKNNDWQLYIGTDSQMTGLHFRFITVVAVYVKGHGGNYFYTTNKKPRTQYKGNHQARMFQEATFSIETGQWIEEQTNVKPTVHIDASKKELNNFTSGFSDQIKGYVMGFGFTCEMKPEAWAASVVADHHSR